MINLKKKLTFLIMIWIYQSSVNAKNLESKCEYESYFKKPCIIITKNISNESSYTKDGTHKINIFKDDIISMGASDLNDVLEHIPGLSVQQSGSKGQQTSVFMRGTNSNHTLVLINGIPINDQSTTQGLHNFGMDFISSIQKIEVFPGASSSNFGSNAIGGAINIITGGDLVDKLHIKGRNKDNNEIYFNKNFEFKDIKVSSQFTNFNEKDVSSRYGGHEKDKSQNKNITLNLEKWSKKNKKIFFNNYFRNNKADYDNSSTNETNFHGDDKMLSTQFGINTVEKNKLSKIITYLNIYDREYNENNTIDEYDSKTFGFKAEENKTYTKSSLGYGIDIKKDYGKFENRGSYSASTDGSVTNKSIYGNIGYKINNNLILSQFVRFDNHEIVGSNISNKTSLTKKFQFVDFSILRSNAIRNPSIYELYGTDNYGYSGNINLKPEKSVNNEFITKIRVKDNFNINLNYYRSAITNYIEYSSNKYINSSSNNDVKQEGIEISSDYKFSKNKIRFFLNNSSSKTATGADQLRRPNQTYGINFNLKNNLSYLGKFTLNLNYKHYGKHFDTHSTSFSRIEMDSTDILDINMVKRINSKKIIFKINNITDEKYQRPHGYSQKGRKIEFGISSQF